MRSSEALSPSTPRPVVPMSLEPITGAEPRRRQQVWFRVAVGASALVSCVALVVALMGRGGEGLRRWGAEGMRSSGATQLSIEKLEDGAEQERGRTGESVDSFDFGQWYRTVSENKWFGSSAFKKNQGPMDKTKYLTRRDCAAAEDAGIDHITKDCLFVCEGCLMDNYVRIGCNTLSEGTCVECAGIGCPPQSYRIQCGGLEPGHCVACSPCPPGQFRKDCFGIEAGVCEDCAHCPAGQWCEGCLFNSAGECKDCQNCGPDMWLDGCSGQNPGVCLSCSTCSADEFEQEACTAISDRACVPCTELEACPTDMYRKDCGHGEKGDCANCEECPHGSWRSGCSGFDAGSCLQCQECPAGQYRAGCTGTSPGTCKACEDCPPESFRTGCFGLDGGTCQPCTKCGPTEYATQPCTATVDRQCGACSELPTCGDAQYRKGCGDGSAGECVSCTACPVGFYRIGCTGESEGTCTACGDCPDGTYRDGCNGVSPGQCSDCPECPPGQFCSGCGGLQQGVCVACDSIPCPPGHDRVNCGGRVQGECVRGWLPDSPPPEDIVWSEHWTDHRCVDDGTDVEQVEHSFLYPHGLVRLAACKEGSTKGSVKLPVKGTWLLQFYVGVPTFKANAQFRPAGYPHERDGNPDETDSVLIDINGLQDTYLNKPDDWDGSKLLYYKVLNDVDTIEFSFNFKSSDNIVHDHMFIANGQAAYIGDNIPKEVAEKHLKEGEGRLVGAVINACDGTRLRPKHHSTDGYMDGRHKKKITLPDEEAQVRLLLGTTDLIDVTVEDAEFQEVAKAGDYACVATYPGFYDFFDPHCHIAKQETKQKPIPMCPFLNPGHARIILSWAALPQDMDARIEVPAKAPGGGRCGVTYQHRFCRDGEVRLDYDQIKGYGPETITIEGFGPGKYVFWVNHFGGYRYVRRATNLDPTLMASEAVVTYYTDLKQRHFILGKHGYVERDDWMVFWIDGETEELHLCTPETCPRPGDGM